MCGLLCHPVPVSRDTDRGTLCLSPPAISDDGRVSRVAGIVLGQGVGPSHPRGSLQAPGVDAASEASPVRAQDFYRDPDPVVNHPTRGGIHDLPGRSAHPPPLWLFRQMEDRCV